MGHGTGENLINLEVTEIMKLVSVVHRERTCQPIICIWQHSDVVNGQCERITDFSALS